MKIVLDNIIFSLQNAGGISTYWYELIIRMLRDGLDVGFIHRPSTNVLARRLNLKQESLYPSTVKSLTIDRFLDISIATLPGKFIFHSSYNRLTNHSQALNVSTIHDFVHEKFYRGARRMIHSYQKSKAINGSNILVAVSNNTKNDLLYYHPNFPADKVKVIYNGVSDDFFEIPKKINNEPPYILFIGSREHYKNFEFAVKLMQIVKEFRFYIVGSEMNYKEKELVERNLPGRWKHFKNINSSELNILYNNAYALLYPSSYEGFGIPLLEAMRAGLPFIALNHSSIPEVAGDAGLLLDALDLDLFVKAIYTVDSNRNKLVGRGLSQVQKFSWEKCYQETLQMYKELYLA